MRKNVLLGKNVLFIYLFFVTLHPQKEMKA